MFNQNYVCKEIQRTPVNMIPSGHYMLKQRRNVVCNNVTAYFQLHFNVVPTSDARWVCLVQGKNIIISGLSDYPDIHDLYDIKVKVIQNVKFRA